jgi:hypothetical protein
MIQAAELLCRPALEQWQPIETLTEKACLSCGEFFPLSEFYSWHTKRKDGTVVAYSSYCKTCDDRRRNERKKRKRMERAIEMERELNGLKIKVASLERTGYFLRYLVLQGINAARDGKAQEWARMARESLDDLDGELGFWKDDETV